MNLIENLDTLYKERYMEHRDIEAWNDAIEDAWPELRAALRAGQQMRETLCEDCVHVYDDANLDGEMVMKAREAWDLAVGEKE